ncbi:MAG TPA: DUF6807 family protein, partial [Chitinophagaceae bacterium]
KRRIKFLFIFFCCLIAIQIKVCGQHFTTTKTGEGVEISENGKKVLFYQERPKSLNGKYERAGYVNPLYDLNEKVLTEDFPEDHPYHRGIFLAWHQIISGNKKIADGWMSENVSYEPIKLKIKKQENFVTLQSEMLWRSVLQNNKPVSIVRENTNITIHKSTGEYRAIDFDIRLFALVDSLKIGGSDDIKGYGGFCLRLKLPKNILFVSQNKEVTPQETAVEAGPWMDIIGSFGNDYSLKTGVAVFDNPVNPGPRGQWILRKETSMQNIPYPGRTPVTLSKSGLRLRYRIIIHNNNVSNDDMEKLYQEYIHKL